jgi:hypothetical protein
VPADGHDPLPIHDDSHRNRREGDVRGWPLVEGDAEQDHGLAILSLGAGPLVQVQGISDEFWGHVQLAQSRQFLGSRINHADPAALRHVVENFKSLLPGLINRDHAFLLSGACASYLCPRLARYQRAKSQRRRVATATGLV